MLTKGRNKICVLVGFLMVWSISTLAQDCLPEGIIFSSQEQIDAFSDQYPGCSHILGGVTISESPKQAIINLEGLSNIARIRGGLNISGNSRLRDLSGLENLSQVGASIRIASNSALTNLKALSLLDTVPGDLSISSNSRLSNLKGLGNLTFVGEHLIITNNGSLPNFEGLEKLQYVGRDLLVQQNAFLRSFEGLGKLHTISAHVVVDANESLSSLRGLVNLKKVNGNFQIVNNNSLNSIADLAALRFVGGLLQIYNNPFLKSLSGIDSVQGHNIEDLAILFSPTLSICHVQSICDYLMAPANKASIRNNANGCGSREEILESCGRAPMSSSPHVRGKSLLYPNPTNGFLTVRGEILEEARFIATDMSGQRLAHGPIKENKIDITLLASGTYVIEITTKEETRNEFVIKM